MRNKPFSLFPTLLVLMPSVLLLACGGDEPVATEPPPSEAAAPEQLQETGPGPLRPEWYTSKDVIAYVNQRNPGFTIPPASGISSSPAEVDVRVHTGRLEVELTVGTKDLSPAIVDTGSTGVVVSCGEWLTNDCTGIGNDLPKAFARWEIYVTDVPTSRGYGHLDNDNLTGYVALASVSLGGVNAAMPFMLANLRDGYPFDNNDLRLVGINSGVDVGFVSPMQYFDYSAGAMDVGFSLTTEAMTIGLVSPEKWTTVQMAPANLVGTQAPTWLPKLPVEIQINSEAASGTSMLFDTGTAPGGGHVYVPTPPPFDCTQNDCTLTTTFNGIAVNQIDSTFQIEQGDPDQRSVIGLEFLGRNKVGSGFMMNFTTGKAGFMVKP